MAQARAVAGTRQIIDADAGLGGDQWAGEVAELGDEARGPEVVALLEELADAVGELARCGLPVS